jgi:hypothetical protein
VVGLKLQDCVMDCHWTQWFDSFDTIVDTQGAGPIDLDWQFESYPSARYS